MPSFGYIIQPAAGPSRKRSHAEITGSTSRSVSRDPPPKRRRTALEASFLPSLSPDTIPTTPEPRHITARGRSAEATVMDNSQLMAGQPHEPIDLTLDDDTPPPSRPVMNSVRAENPQRLRQWTTTAFPPQPFLDHIPTPAVIDLSRDDEDVGGGYGPHTDPRGEVLLDTLQSSSPEVEFLREQTVPQSRSTYIRDRYDHQQQQQQQPPPPPPPRRPFLPPPTRAMADLFRGMTQWFGGLRNRDIEDVLLDQYQSADPEYIANFGREHSDLAIYDNVDLDYAQAGFNMGNFPDVVLDENLAPRTGADSDYKPPPKPREGFTRSYQEDDFLICSYCGDELSTGGDEIKAQVWVAKQCGHMYCGHCATRRTINKGGNKRDETRSRQNKTTFRECQIPGCHKNLSTKTAMFQLYL